MEDKYLNYTLKYNNLKKLCGGNKKSTLLSLKDINNLYSHKYRFYKLYKANELDIVFNYIKMNFKFTKDIKLEKFEKYAKEKKSDSYFYLYLRKNYNDNYKNIVNYQTNFYKTKHLVKKINSIIKTIKKSYLTKFNYILDIGTEDETFIDILEEMFKCKVSGLNIDVGYEHYKQFNKNNSKIILYDGINFPFKENQISLVIIMAVIHHIHNIEMFFNNLCKIAKVIYIKDNDISNKLTKYNIDIQHEVYEGILYPNNRSPLYYYTNEYIVKLLKKNNFKILSNNIFDKFTKTYVLLACKN